MRRRLLVFSAFVAFIACSSNGVKLTPQPQTGSSAPASTARPSPSPGTTTHATPSATPAASAHPTPSPTPTSTSVATQINAAIADVESMYQTLPHSSVSSDLQALTSLMTGSGAFSRAVVTPGGIDATMTSGQELLFFADRPEDLAGTFDASAVRRAARSTVQPSATSLPISPANGHEIAFLVNESGDSAFHPGRQQNWGAAFSKAGFTSAAGYGVDVQDITLDNILALGSGHAIDFLEIATHGMLDNQGNYFLLSTTNITDEGMQTYAADLLAKRVKIGEALFYNEFITQQTDLGTFLFTPAFLTAHLTFNPGAIVDNQSCHGQDPRIAISAGPTLRTAGVGRYLGWTKTVDNWDADTTDAFIIDRMLGEQSPSVTGMDQYAPQRTPPQRAFPLDQIQTVMQTEIRPHFPLEPPLADSNEQLPYDQSRTGAQLVINDYGGESVANPPIEYALPSISHVVADEVNGQLDILGTFPATPGTVTITNASGSATPAPVSWTTNEVIVPLPSAGVGSYGMVSVTDAGITSNAVPLTEWTGRITYSANGSLSNWAGDTGSGSFSLQGVFNAILRADVHPTVVTIDASPVPQMFAFTGLAPGSSGALTAGSGNFTSDNSQGNSCKNCSITLGLVNPQPTMVPQPLSSGSANAFFVLPETGPTPPAGVSVPSPPANCNAGVPGPAPSNTNPLMFCGFLYYNVNNPITCTGNANYCSIANGPLMDELPLNPGVDYLAPSFTLTMDPIFYRLTFASSQQALDLDPFGEPSTGTASLGGTFQAPQSAPGSTTPAFRLRRF